MDSTKITAGGFALGTIGTISVWLLCAVAIGIAGYFGYRLYKKIVKKGAKAQPVVEPAPKEALNA